MSAISSLILPELKAEPMPKAEAREDFQIGRSTTHCS
uniref:Uncharacterized protein n=1 Tax=Anguilla anguilla TaxID=7936 RepID=A0A0E9TLP0_ANGAN